MIRSGILRCHTFVVHFCIFGKHQNTLYSAKYSFDNQPTTPRQFWTRRKIHRISSLVQSFSWVRHHWYPFLGNLTRAHDWKLSTSRRCSSNSLINYSSFKQNNLLIHAFLSADFMSSLAADFFYASKEQNWGMKTLFFSKSCISWQTTHSKFWHFSQKHKNNSRTFPSSLKDIVRSLATQKQYWRICGSVNKPQASIQTFT